MNDTVTACEPYTPERLVEYALLVRRVRMELENNTDTAAADNESLAYFAVSIAALESAFRFLELAIIKQRQGLVGKEK